MWRVEFPIGRKIAIGKEYKSFTNHQWLKWKITLKEMHQLFSFSPCERIAGTAKRNVKNSSPVHTPISVTAENELCLATSRQNFFSKFFSISNWINPLSFFLLNFETNNSASSLQCHISFSGSRVLLKCMTSVSVLLLVIPIEPYNGTLDLAMLVLLFNLWGAIIFAKLFICLFAFLIASQLY